MGAAAPKKKHSTDSDGCRWNAFVISAETGGEWEPTHRGESPIARFVCLAVGFEVAAVGRGDGQGLRVVVEAEA